MVHGWRGTRLAKWGLAGAMFVAAAGISRADDSDAELQALLERQSTQIEQLKRQVDAKLAAQVRAQTSAQDPAQPGLDEGAVKRIVGEYLKENPGAGMPSSVQSGYSIASGFFVRSTPNPRYAKWEDDSRIPFELRIRGRLQLAYYYYKVTDRTNHLTNVPATQNANSVRLADFSQLEAKRIQVIFEGTAFDPDLRYHFRLHGDTRGLPGLQNNRVLQIGGAFDPNGAATATGTGGGVFVDHGVRLFEAWVAYDFHGCASEKGCGPDCPEGAPRYRPTYTLIFGKIVPFFGLEHYLNNATEQFVEYNMSEQFFSPDDDNRLMAAGLMVKSMEDRFFTQAIVTNGSESIFPNSQMSKLPGFISGFWYDFGGSWNAERQAWDLFGDGISDIDYSCRPVVRVGGSVDLVPIDRRSLYGDAEQSRYGTVAAGPGGTKLINLLNGDGATALPAGAHAVDMLDAYSYNAFFAGKYRGASLLNEWWVRNLNNFRTTPNGLGNIIYQDNLGPGGAAANALFPKHGLIDYGMNLQAGYFIVPKKLEIAARWAWIRGQSGDTNGNGTFRTVTIPGVAGAVHVVNGAFRNFHEANEYTVGFGYFFKRHLLKWQTDFGIYDGGNPAVNGASISGFIPGSDGYLVRTQMQLFF